MLNKKKVVSMVFDKRGRGCGEEAYQDGNANHTIRIDVRVPHWCHEAHLGWKQRIFLNRTATAEKSQLGCGILSILGKFGIKRPTGGNVKRALKKPPSLKGRKMRKYVVCCVHSREKGVLEGFLRADDHDLPLQEVIIVDQTY